jgi:hypothetical protein
MVHGGTQSQLDTWSTLYRLRHRQSHQGVCSKESSALLDIQLANPPIHEEHLFWFPCTPFYATFSIVAWTPLTFSAQLVLPESREFSSSFSPPLWGPWRQCLFIILPTMNTPQSEIRRRYIQRWRLIQSSCLPATAILSWPRLWQIGSLHPLLSHPRAFTYM